MNIGEKIDDFKEYLEIGGYRKNLSMEEKREITTVALDSAFGIFATVNSEVRVLVRAIDLGEDDKELFRLIRNSILNG